MLFARHEFDAAGFAVVEAEQLAGLEGLVLLDDGRRGAGGELADDEMPLRFVRLGDEDVELEDRGIKGAGPGLFVFARAIYIQSATISKNRQHMRVIGAFWGGNQRRLSSQRVAKRNFAEVRSQAGA